MTPKIQEIRFLGAQETPKNQELQFLGEQATPKNKGFSILGAFLPGLRILLLMTLFYCVHMTSAFRTSHFSPHDPFFHRTSYDLR